MSPLEYILLFIAIILGLAASDIAMSLHRLLSAGARVRWDWIAPLAALVAFMKIVTLWWTWFGVGQIARGLTFEMFVAVVAGAVLLFLLSAASLPDEVAEGPIDLRAHWSAVSRRWWSLFVLHWVVFNGLSIWAQVQIEHARFDWRAWPYLVLPLAISLIFIRNRWVQTICLAGLVVVYVGQFFGQALAS
jgi:hypothetical protein